MHRSLFAALAIAALSVSACATTQDYTNGSGGSGRIDASAPRPVQNFTAPDTSVSSQIPTAPATSGPAVYADKTTLDERLGINATYAYTAASKLGAAAARAGVIDRVKFKALDNRGYDAVLSIKGAYLAANQRSYAAAVAMAWDVVRDMTKLATPAQ